MRPVARSDDSFWKGVQVKRLNYISQDHLNLEDLKS